MALGGRRAAAAKQRRGQREEVVVEVTSPPSPAVPGVQPKLGPLTPASWRAPWSDSVWPDSLPAAGQAGILEELEHLFARDLLSLTIENLHKTRIP